MQTPDLVYALGLPPRDAVAYLESKGIRPSRHWYDIWQEAQAKAVTVSGMTRLDLLEDVKKGLVDAVKNGKTGKMFIDDLTPILRAKGWTGKRQSINPKTGEVTEKGPDLPARLSLIFFQNVQSAYMYGRYRAMLANAEERPWWMYIAVLDSRTRPHHRALHRKVFRYDDPFWKTHYPPNGWRCRCRTRALSDTQLEREGLIPESGEGRMVSREVVVNPRAPESQQVVREVWGWQERPGGLTHWTDTGFSYSAGYTTYQLDCELAQKLEFIKSDTLYAEVVQTINDSPARHAAFGLWIEEKLASKWKTGDAVVVGLVQPEVVAAAKAAGRDPSRIVVMTDEKVIRYRCNGGYGFWQQAVCCTDDLTAANFQLALEAMQGFKADGGRPLGLGFGGKAGTLLVVPPTLQADAREILVAERDQYGASNIWFDAATIVVSPWLA